MKKLSYIAAATMIAIAGFIAGCGGGGGTTATNSPTNYRYGNIKANVNFGVTSAAKTAARNANNGSDFTVEELAIPTSTKMYQGCENWILEKTTYNFDDNYSRVAGSTTSSSSEYYSIKPPASLAASSTVPVYLWVAKNPGYLAEHYAKSLENTGNTDVNPVASACAMLSCSGWSTDLNAPIGCSGEFDIKNVAVGDNLLLEASAYAWDDDGCYNMSTNSYEACFIQKHFVAGLVASVVEGQYTTGVEITPTSTLVAISAMAYATDTGQLLSSISQTDVNKIITAVSGTSGLFPSGIKYGETTYSGSTLQNYYSFTNTIVESVLNSAGLSGPHLSSFSPESGSKITYDAPVFKAVFNEALDTSVTPTGFTATITNSYTGNTFTINNSNATDYGTFSYESSGSATDTLVYTLKSSSVLSAAGLHTLSANSSYYISDFSMPTNIKNADGEPWIASLDSLMPYYFYIYTYTGPVLVSTSPANGAADVAYDGTTFDAVFNMALDTSVTPSGFSVSLVNSSTGGYLTIDDTNISDYGTYSYITTTVTNDTLRFTLKSSSELSAAGLSTLYSGTTYTISNYTLPANVKDSAGNIAYDPNSVVPSENVQFTTEYGSDYEY